MHLVDYNRNQELLMETPPAIPDRARPDRTRAQVLIGGALRDGRTVLTEPEAKGLLAAYGIPVVAVHVAADPAEAGRLAAGFSGPAVLKILSPDITHKSDVGGVRLDLRSREAVEAAACDMLARVRAHAPAARLEGFSVQEMIDRPDNHELICGIADDATFGPVMVFGQGGVAVEVVGDRAIGLPPLNMVLAREMIARTRVSKLLAGYRHRPAASLDAIAHTLVRVSDMLVDLPEIVELDINPLLAGPEGVLALDARVVVRPAEAAAGRRLAIQPYPSELEHDIVIDGGRRMCVRPIRPEDEPRLVEMVARSSQQDVRLRFLGALKEFPHLLAARLSQIDYDREMALVASVPAGDPDGDEILGVARIVADPENERAEFAVMVRSDMKGRGLGFQLMKDILSVARSRGLHTVHGDVLAENTTMLAMAAELGFERRLGEDGVVQVSIDL
jgi:acetyltransferase